MQQEMIEDILLLKKILYKTNDIIEKIEIYEQINLIIDLYSKLYGNIKNNNTFKIKELNNIKSLYKQKYNTETLSILKTFDTEQKFYKQLYYELIDILNDYQKNNNMKTKLNNVDINILEKILLKYDKNMYNYYREDSMNKILILNHNIDDNLLGMTCNIKHLNKCYSVSEDNISTYIHEYSHIYQSSKINNNKIKNILIEIFPNSVELISGKLNKNNRNDYKTRYLIQLKYFLEEINLWIKNQNGTLNTNTIDYDIQNIIGLISCLNLFFIYFENRDNYFNIINNINENINEINSIKNLQDIIPGMNVNNYKKLIKEFINY